jgi:hypothetical protein
MAQTKTIVIGCVALVLLAGAVVVCAVGGIFMLGINAVVDKAEQEGVAFGKSTDQQGCQDEAFRHLRAAIKKNDLLKGHEVSIFINGCFQSCKPTVGYCTNAPKEDAFFSTLEWSKSQCVKEGFGDDHDCPDIFIEVSNACLGKTPRLQK